MDADQGFYHDLELHDQQTLKDALVWITLLISGSDGSIHDDELAWAEKLTQIRSYASEAQLHEMYAEGHQWWAERMSHWKDAMPGNLEEQQSFLSNQLSTINPILSKLNKTDQIKLYKSLCSFAEKIAQGPTRLFKSVSIHPNEKVWIKLPMIQNPLNQ